jgi:prevent-host-death family protein
MKQVSLSEVQKDLAGYLRLAEEEEIVITRHGKPAGVLIGFESEDDWFECRLERDPRFLKRIEATRESQCCAEDDRGDPDESGNDRRLGSITG